MNKLPLDKQAKILGALCEGLSMRAISRLENVSINTVTKLLVDAGETCLALHDELVRSVRAERVQCDEIWSFRCAKQRNVPTTEGAPEGMGDVWTWTALDADTKLMISYLVGDRSGQSARILADDLRARTDSERVQFTTDGHNAYLRAVEEAFGADAGYAAPEAIYQTHPKAARARYSPPVVTGIKTNVIEGGPDMVHVCTSHVERTIALSTRFQNHVHALALYFASYNFVRDHQALRMPPALAAGITDKAWTMGDIIERMEGRRAASAKRGPYIKPED